MNFFLRVFSFIKQYPGIIYSFLLIVFLPGILYYNTLLSTKAFQSNIDYVIQSKALLVDNVLKHFFALQINQPELIQEQIIKIVKENPEIQNLRVLTKDGEEFKIIASQIPEEIGAKTKDPSLVLSFSQDQTIANLINQDGQRLWNVITPFYDKDGKKLGLVSMALSLLESDRLISKTIFRAYIIVIVAIVLTLFLVFHHTRLFGYVALTKKLKEIDKMKDDFIRMATHELQTPIVNIKGYLQMLEEEIKEKLSPEEKEFFERVKISAKNLSELMYDILEVARIEQGRLDFTPKEVYPPEIIREALEEFRMKAEEKNLKLLSEIVDDPQYYIKVNPNRLRQILKNLIENAIKYTKKGHILIKTQIVPEKKRYIIEVSDTGIGISAEHQKKLFEKFYRVKTKETADIPGTGLGLWITKQLCEKMGGKIFLESIKGTGTKFTLIFPLFKKSKKFD